MTIKNQIKYCLERYPETRNDDIALTIKVWENFPPFNEDKGEQVKIIFSQKTGKNYIALDDLHWLQREDGIKRIRADIQNKDGLWLPTDPRVAEFRKKDGRGESLWKERLGYKTKPTHEQIQKAIIYK
jgi:hypothetical protein